MSFIGPEGRVHDIVDLVREVDVRVENPHSIVVIVAHFDVLENVVTEVNLQSRLECVSSVVEESSSFNLEKLWNYLIETLGPQTMVSSL